MCDNKCGGGNNNRSNDCKSIEGPPQNLPQWLRCPPEMREKAYPVPEGVTIKPISQGGRNGNSKKAFKCGQCGQDNKKKDAKPNAPADCPMMKARCPGAMDKLTDMVKGGSEGKGSSSVVDRIKNFFGGKNEKLGLVDLCKAVMVSDDQITHHRDVFSSELYCGKDGYFSPFPFFTKVDCQGKPEEEDCTCEEEEEEEECEEWEDEEDEEEECEEEEEEPQCTCDYGGDNQEEVQDAGGGGDDEEEECVQDGEGECVLEESAECLDESCKLFMDHLNRNDKKKDDISFDEYCKCKNPEKDCSAMNNFIIRVSSPTSSGASTNETCEQIIARLTQKKYPEPGPVKEKKDKEGCEPKEVEIVVKQICVAEPTCECPPKCKEPPPPPPPPPPPKDDCQKPPPPPPPKDNCEKPPPPPPKDDCQKPPPPKDDCEKPPPPKDDCQKPPPPKDDCEKPPPPKDDCQKPPPPKDDCEKPSPPKDCGCKEPPPPPPNCEPPPEDDCKRPPRGSPPNDCAILSELELLRKPIKQITCGCPKFLCSKCESDAPGASYAGENSVWIPPPPPPCARCGASERGGTEDCYLCHLTRKMRLGLQEKTDCINFPGLEDDCEVEEKPKEEPDDLCTPEYLPDGSVKYKGGMCLSWAGTFLWKVFKREPPGGFFDRYTGECGEEARLKALGDGLAECNAEKERHAGGDSLENTRRYLWGEKRIDEKEEEEEKKKKRVCKQNDEGKDKKKASQCPPREEE